MKRYVIRDGTHGSQLHSEDRPILRLVKVLQSDIQTSDIIELVRYMALILSDQPGYPYNADIVCSLRNQEVR